MHGACASSQQKILVMHNGHRLNSQVYAMAAPDWSISLDWLARVEVLRGPGSSLYGNVALIVVVNLVTKRPWEVEGTQVTLGSGNHGQRLLSVVAGHDQPGDEELRFLGAVVRQRRRGPPRRTGTAFPRTAPPSTTTSRIAPATTSDSPTGSAR